MSLTGIRSAATTTSARGSAPGCRRATPCRPAASASTARRRTSSPRRRSGRRRPVQAGARRPRRAIDPHLVHLPALTGDERRVGRQCRPLRRAQHRHQGNERQEQQQRPHDDESCGRKLQRVERLSVVHDLVRPARREHGRQARRSQARTRRASFRGSPARPRGPDAMGRARARSARASRKARPEAECATASPAAAQAGSAARK